MAAAPYLFQIFLADWKGIPSDLLSRSIIVEVAPRVVPEASAAGDKDKTERQFAERLARRVSAEFVQGEFNSGAEPGNSIAQIGSLPDEIQGQSPTVYRNGVRAWLL
ncbi:MAG: hypothetical protein JO334_13925 [Verrucomicrobia bacterium]|nr:hypothetical protein [Verrucomicrobiota bacterium]